MSDKIFNTFELTDGKINIIEFQKYLFEKGIYKTNPHLTEFKNKTSKNKMKVFYTKEEFNELIKDNIFFINKIMKDEFVIPHFEDFSSSIKEIYKETEDPRSKLHHKEDVRDVIEICAIGDLNSLKYYQLKNLDFNKSDYDGRTPLHLACSNGHLNIVKHLIENCSLKDIYQKDRWGNSPLDDALREGYNDISNYISNL
jgi:ankyrin repeat protein